MIRNRRKVILLIIGSLLPLACICTELFPTESPPTTSHAPLVEGTSQPVASRGTTDQEGKVIVVDSQGSEKAIVQVEDEDSRLPVSGVEVYFMQRGSSYLAIAIDPEGRYLTSWSQGSLEELNSSSSSLTTVVSFLSSRPAYAQPLPLILLLVKGVSTVSSLKDLGAYLQNPPELVYWAVLYEDRCWTGEQLANYVGAAGLILPGVDEVAGVLVDEMDEIARAIFLLSQHVIEEDAKGQLLGLDRPVRIRSYHLGIPALGMVPVGWCELEATPVPPTDTPALAATPMRSPTLAKNDQADLAVTDLYPYYGPKPNTVQGSPIGTVFARIKNNGPSALTDVSVPISCTSNLFGQTWTDSRSITKKGVIQLSLVPGQSEDFNTWIFVHSADGSWFEVTCSISVDNDPNPSNNTYTKRLP